MVTMARITKALNRKVSSVPGYHSDNWQSRKSVWVPMRNSK